LVFKGGNKYTATEIAEITDATGGEMNAYTSIEHTAFYFKVLKEDLKDTLDVLKDIVLYPRLDEADIQTEKGVILSEISSMYDSPQELSSHGIFMAAWGSHPSTRPVLGNAGVIGNSTSESIRAFHNARYVDDDMLISLSGAIAHDEATDMLRESGIVCEELSGKVSPTVEKTTFTNRKYACNFDCEQVYFTYAWSGPTLGSPEIELEMVSNSILAGSFSSRLFQRLREKEGLVYNVAGFATALTHGGLVGVYGSVPMASFAKTDTILREEIGRFKRDGVTHEELERAKSMIRGSTALSQESNMAIMHRMGKLGILLGYVPSLDELLDRISRIDDNRINSYIKDSTPDDFAVSVVGKKVTDIDGFTEYDMRSEERG